MLDAHELGRRPIVVVERRALAAEIGVERGEWIVHRHRPTHDLLLIVSHCSDHCIGSEEDRSHEIVLDLGGVLELVHEQVRVGQTEGVARHRIDAQEQFGEPSDHRERQKGLLSLVQRRLPESIRRPLADCRVRPAQNGKR